MYHYPDNKVHGANMGPAWGRQELGGPQVSHVNLAMWVVSPVMPGVYALLLL